MKEIAFAPADPADRDEILARLQEHLREEQVAVAVAPLAQAVDGVLGDPEHGFFHVARTGHTVIGIAYVALVWSLQHAGRAAWLEQLYVVPEWRGQGVGRELFAAAMERARWKGCVAVDAEVTSDHARAEHLIQSEGFTPVVRSRWARRLADE